MKAHVEQDCWCGAKVHVIRDLPEEPHERFDVLGHPTGCPCRLCEDYDSSFLNEDDLDLGAWYGQEGDI